MALLRDILFGAQQPVQRRAPAPARADQLEIGRQMYDYLIAQGLSPQQAAAMAGNLVHEGGGRADSVNPGDNWRNAPDAPHSVGIAQWNGPRARALFDFARSNGIDLPQGDMRDERYVQNAIRRIPLNTQLDFALNEMRTGEGQAYSNLRDAQDLRGAVRGAIGFFRPQGFTRDNPEGGAGFSGRLSLADQILRAADTATPQPPDGMDDRSYRPAATPLPVDLAQNTDRAPSGGRTGGLLSGLMDGIGLGGMTNMFDVAEQQAGNRFSSARQPDPETTGGIVYPTLPKLDLTRLRALIQRRQAVGLGTGVRLGSDSTEA